MTTTVRDNPEARRFEISVDGKLAGFAQYRLSGDRITFTHTEVDPDAGQSGRPTACSGRHCRTAPW